MPEIMPNGAIRFRDYGRGNIEPLSSLRGLVPPGGLYHVDAWRAHDGVGGYGVWQWNGTTLIAANVPDPYSKQPAFKEQIGKPWGTLYPGRKPVSLTPVDATGRIVAGIPGLPKSLSAAFGSVFGQTTAPPLSGFGAGPAGFGAFAETERIGYLRSALTFNLAEVVWVKAEGYGETSHLLHKNGVYAIWDLGAPDYLGYAATLAQAKQNLGLAKREETTKHNRLSPRGSKLRHEPGDALRWGVKA